MGMTTRTWMTTDDVMRELKFSTPDATRKWLRRLRVVGISRYPRGRTKIFARADVEKALTDARRRQVFRSDRNGHGWRVEQAEKTEVS